MCLEKLHRTQRRAKGMIGDLKKAYKRKRKIGFNLKIRGLRENTMLKIMGRWKKCLGKDFFKKQEDRYCALGQVRRVDSALQLCICLPFAFP